MSSCSTEASCSAPYCRCQFRAASSLCNCRQQTGTTVRGAVSARCQDGSSVACNRLCQTCTQTKSGG
jgi:hypothetical protein